MKVVLRDILLISILSLLVMCDKEEITSRNYPRLNTLPVTEITSKGALFNAEIKFRGDFEVINYGFVWSEYVNPTKENSDRVIYAKNIETDHYSKTIETTLKEGVNYYVRAFVETDDYIVYGENVSFISLGSKAPEIKTINPGIGTIGDTIEIQGLNFSYLDSMNKVFFHGIRSKIVSSSDTLVKAIVPVVDKGSVKVALSIQGNVSIYDGSFDLITPVIEDFFPKQAAIDDTIRVTGKNFSYLPENNILKIGGMQCKIVSSSKNQIKAIIPSELALQNTVSLSIAGQEFASNKQFEFIPPIFNSIDKTSVIFDEEVTLVGQNLSFIPESNLISLDGVQAEVVYASRENIRFKIPTRLSHAENTLTLKVAGRTFDYKSIRIKAPVIKSIEKSEISNVNYKNLRISGENFNPLPGKNIVLLGDQRATVVSSTNDQIIAKIPTGIIPNIEISFSDTFDVSVKILDQSTVLKESWVIDYKSIWTKMKAFTGNARRFGAYFAIGGKGYIGLGESSDEKKEYFKDFWEYDPTNDRWTRLEDFPGTERSKFATFVIGNNAYIICGTKDNPYISGNNLNQVWEFNGSLRKWTQKKDFPGGARWNSFGFSTGEFGYVGGGVYGESQRKYDFWKYDPNTDSWNQLKDILRDIWNDDILSISSTNTAYILSGLNESERWFWEYDEINNKWTALPNCSYTNNAISGFLIGNKIYAGLGGTWAWYNYDTSSNTWNYGKFFPGEYKRGASSFTIDKFGYILFGEYQTSDTGLIVWKFDPSKLN